MIFRSRRFSGDSLLFTPHLDHHAAHLAQIAAMLARLDMDCGICSRYSFRYPFLNGVGKSMCLVYAQFPARLQMEVDVSPVAGEAGPQFVIARAGEGHGFYDRSYLVLKA